MNDNNLKRKIKKQGVLSHLANTFTDQRENLVTEALGFVLRESLATRGAMESLLSDCCGNKISVHTVRNQVVAEEESRPDLATYDNKGNLTTYIEAKLWAGLTPSQPNRYLSKLKELKGKALLFIVPSERIESILGELSERIKKEGLKRSKWTDKGKFKIAKMQSGVVLIVSSWRTIISSLRDACARSEDPHSIGDLEQIDGLIEGYEADGFTPMSDEELSNLEIPRRIVSLVNLCVKVFDKAKDQGILKFTNSWTAFDYGAGRYFSLKKAGCWIGLENDSWSCFQASPLWMEFYTGKWGRAEQVRPALERLEYGTPKRLFVDEEGNVCIPLRIIPGASEDLVVDGIIDQIKSVIDELDKSSMTNLK